MSSLQQQFYHEIATILEQSHFELSTPLVGCGGCFDLIAKKQNLLLLIKINFNIDSLREDQAFELRKLTLMLNGFPLIIGQKIRSNTEMEEGVVYTRYDIPALSVETFRNLIINNLPPLIYACRGGFKVKFDGSMLKERRTMKNLSLGDFAREIGISKRAIYEYEHNTVDISLETAIKIEEFLDEPLTLAINLFEDMKQIGSVTIPCAYDNEPKSDIERQVKNHFDTIGLKDQLWTKKIPIRVLAKCFIMDESHKATTTITGISEKSQKEDLEKKVHITYSISKIAEAEPLLVVGFKDKPEVTFEGVPIFSIDELKKKRDANLE